MSPSAVALARVSKRLGSHQALSDITLEIASRDTVVIVGPSGSGKTTLLRLIAGLDVPDAGTIALHGRLVAEAGRTVVPPHRRGIGYVFQDLALWPHLTVAGQLGFVLEAQHVPRTEWKSRVQQILNLAGIRGLAERFPHQLSGGEQQRAALARALVGQPVVLLLDEPFASLDPELRATLRHELARLRHDLGLTIVYVTHDRDDVEGLATRVVEMRSGQISRATA